MLSAAPWPMACSRGQSDPSPATAAITQPPPSPAGAGPPKTARRRPAGLASASAGTNRASRKGLG
jgi:hypothetical protein